MGFTFIIANSDYSSDKIRTVTPKQAVPVTALSITGDSTKTGETATFSVTYTPSDTTQRGVIWEVVSGGEYAEFEDSSIGVLTIKQSANNSTIIVRAKSAQNQSIVSSNHSIVVTYKPAPVTTWFFKCPDSDENYILNHNNNYVYSNVYVAMSSPGYTGATLGNTINKIRVCSLTNGTITVGRCGSNVTILEPHEYPVVQGWNEISIDPVVISQGEYFCISCNNNNIAVVSGLSVQNLETQSSYFGIKYRNGNTTGDLADYFFGLSVGNEA